jgi:hypothetical protein
MLIMQRRGPRAMLSWMEDNPLDNYIRRPDED